MAEYNIKFKGIIQETMLGPLWARATYIKKYPEIQIPKWSSKIQLIDWYPFWTRTPLNPSWDKNTLKMIKTSRWLKTGKFIQIKFIE